MSDEQAKRILAAVAELQAELRELSARMEPVARLHQGNGRPSLEARLYHLEQENERIRRLASWSIRSAVTGMASALAAVAWSLLGGN